jgi:hypothetical protein
MMRRVVLVAMRFRLGSQYRSGNAAPKIIKRNFALLKIMTREERREASERRARGGAGKARPTSTGSGEEAILDPLGELIGK